MTENISNTTNPAPKKKKGKLRKLLYFLIFVIIIWVYNNFTLKISRQTLYYDNVKNEIKIVALSDLHAEKYGISNKTIITAIKKENPDIVFALGDMYSNYSVIGEENIEISVELMSTLISDGYPVYFVPGEHDNDKSYLQTLSENNIKVMDYKTDVIRVDDTNIQIYGINNVYFTNTFNLNNEFDSPSDDVFSILLAHIPMYDYYEHFGADLTLCGDTHGEVVRLPLIGPLYVNGWILPKITSPDNPLYDKGLFPYENGNMYITSGIGNYPFPARFCNRPEIVSITILPETKKESSAN